MISTVLECQIIVNKPDHSSIYHLFIISILSQLRRQSRGDRYAREQRPEHRHVRGSSHVDGRLEGNVHLDEWRGRL